jgi:hypothetical protein
LFVVVVDVHGIILWRKVGNNSRSGGSRSKKREWCERKIEDGAMRKETDGNGRKQREGWRGREGVGVEVVQGPKAKAELHRGPLTSIAIQS